MSGLIIRRGKNINRVWGSVSQRTIVPGGNINSGDPSKMRPMMAGDTRPLQELVALRGSQIQFSQMVDIPGMPGKRIMPPEVTVGLFRQAMEGHEFSGHNAKKLIDILANTALAGQPLNYVSKLDGEAFARRLSQQTNRRFRVQTEAEWEAARDLLKGNLWTWTDTLYSEGYFVLRHLDSADRNSSYPGNRFNDGGLRLVEDI